MKLSDYVLQGVRDAGVEHVFFVPGGMAMHLNDSLGSTEGLEHVCTLHEQAAAIAAEAYAKTTGNLGVALVTAGPGATNAVTGVAGAWMDSTPMLVISGQVKRADLMGLRGVRSMGLQEVDICRVVSSITKYAVTVAEPTDIRHHFEQALHLARSGRPGPVWLDLPLDVQATQVEPTSLQGFTAPTGVDAPAGLEADVGEVIAMLNAAERPVVIVGNGVRLAGAEDRARALLAHWQVPYAATWLSFDLFDHNDPLLVGRPGGMASRGANFAVQNSDLLLMIGARMDNAMTAFAPQHLARGARRIMVDVDPAELDKLKPILHKSICVDAGVFLDEMLRQSARMANRDRRAWADRCAGWKARYPLVTEDHRRTGRVSMFRFAELLGQLTSPGDVIVPTSSGVAVEMFLMSYAPPLGQRVFVTTALGAMGFGLPAAIGACLASRRHRTVCIEGDGGIQLNIQELETLARLRLPVKLFVVNNGGYGAIRSSQQRFFGRVTGADPSSGLTLPDLSRLARAYELPFRRIEHQDDGTQDALAQVLESPGPVVCELMARPDELPAPRAAARQLPDGRMASSPMEDLWPFLGRDELAENMIVPPLSTE